MIAKSIITSVLEAALSTGGDFAELFIEDTPRGSINFLDGQLESSQTGRDFGVGIRIFNGLNCIYAYTNSFEKDSLVKTALKAAQAIKGNTSGITAIALCSIILMNSSPRIASSHSGLLAHFSQVLEPCSFSRAHLTHVPVTRQKGMLGTLKPHEGQVSSM